MAEAIRFHIQTDLPTGDLGLLWLDLEKRADITFFLSWDWMTAWIAELGRCPPVLIGEASGALILLGLVVPRYRREAGVIRVNGLSLHTTGERAKDCIAIEYNGFLVDREWSGKAEREAVTYLLRKAIVGGRRRDELHIVGMPERTGRLLHARRHAGADAVSQTVLAGGSKCGAQLGKDLSGHIERQYPPADTTLHAHV